MGRILLFENGLDGEAAAFTASLPAGDAVRREDQLQRLVFEHPELIPIEEIDPGAGAVAPLCRELSLRRASGPVFLDMIGVSRRGRLVLVECKLWRNPQARREVIGQVLEYAALLRNFSYGDLAALVAARTGRSDENLLWALCRERLGLSDEAAFVDAVSDSLAQGAFDLLVLGDGIRSEVEVVRSYLEAAGLRSRLALVEVRAWSDDRGRLMLVPQVALRTRIVEHRVAVADAPASLSNAALEAAEGRDGPSALTSANRAFWQKFIDEVRFSHPDQPPPGHGGNNWVRLAMPIGQAVAYRAGGPSGPSSRYGVFLRLRGEDGKPVYDGLLRDLDAVEREVGEPVVTEWVEGRGAWDVSISGPQNGAAEDAQAEWLKSRADRFVSALRPRLAALKADLAEG